ncbi:MAG: hypothetical protein KIA12_01115 [Varibaculum cambriense]|uniref:hypothetical protein n=1 Tax=Varibaculum cambriense TaxID=184870 RepID=UPI00241E1B08|nr:hypothetical protein [Varibaculum cambriense]MBS5972080.1 hypothetical protein [Varibaculum cambriense]
MRLKNFAKTLVSGVCATALIPAGLLAVAAAGNLAEESPAGNLTVSTSVANTPKFLTGCIGSDQLGYENVRINKLPAGKDWFLTVSDSDQSPFASRDSYTNPNAGGYMYTFDPAANDSERALQGSVGSSGLGLAGTYHFKNSVKDLHPWVFVQLEDEIYGALKVSTGCEYDFSTILENNTFDKYLEIKKFLVNPQAVKQDWNPLLTLHQFRAPEAADFKVLDTPPAPQPSTDPDTEPSHPDVPEVPDTPETPKPAETPDASGAPTVDRQAPTLDAASKNKGSKDSKQTAPSAGATTAPSAPAQQAAPGQRQAADPAPAQTTRVRTVIQNRENTRTVTVPGPIRYREAPATSSNNASNNNSSTTTDNSAKPAQEGSGSAQEATGNGTASQVQGVEEPKAAPSAPAAARDANVNPSVVDRMGGLGTIAAIAVLGLIGAGGAIALTRSLMNG